MTDSRRGNEDSSIDTEQDRYPPIRKVIEYALSIEDWPEGDIELFQVSGLASGEATYRVWPAKADEPVSGYLTTADLEDAGTPE